MAEKNHDFHKLEKMQNDCMYKVVTIVNEIHTHIRTVESLLRTSIRVRTKCTLVGHCRQFQTLTI